MPVAASAAAPQRPWNLLLQSLVIDGGQVDYRDALPERPVQWQASGVALKVKDFAPLSSTAQAAPLQLSLRIAGNRRSQVGSLAYDGSLRVAPLLVQGTVRASDLPLHAFEPYIADLLNVRVLRAGETLAGLCQQIYGDATLYLKVARANQLDSVRRVPAGTRVRFPPLQK